MPYYYFHSKGIDVYMLQFGRIASPKENKLMTRVQIPYPLRDQSG